MRICVNFRDPPPANLKEGNLRSEARWERQVLEACILNPEISDIYSCGYSWPGYCSKYRGMIDHNSAPGTILLMQDWNYNVIVSYNFKAVLVNIFSGPWVEQIGEAQSAFARLNGRLFFTMGFPIMYRNELGSSSRDGSINPNGLEVNSHLLKFVPRDNVVLLPVPAAPYINEENHFDKTNLLWVSRLVFMSQMAESATLNWALTKLEQDPSLTLDVLTGWFQHEVKDYINEQVVLKPNITEAFWQLDAFKSFSPSVRNRTTIHLDLSWEQVLSKYNNSKLLTTYGRMFGGPPIEAGMNGIPFVGLAQSGALGDCTDYQYSDDASGACNILERLILDRDFYTKVGNAYRSYVADHYTYVAFNNNLNKIITDRNL